MGKGKTEKAEGYRVIRGLSWRTPTGKERTAEPGDIVKDLPVESIANELAAGSIEPADTESEDS